MIQRLALKRADRTARTARCTNCQTVFTEWHTSTTQSILSTRISLGFGVLIDWATSMWKSNFIGMYVKLIYPDHFQHEQNHIIYGYHHPPKKVVKQSFNLLLAIQQVTTNSTWFAVSCIPKIRSMQLTANIRRLGFDILIDWATAMRNVHFISTYAGWVHRSRSTRLLSTRLLNIQCVTANSTWFATRGHSRAQAQERHIQVKNSPASIIAAVACRYAVRHSFERQINGHAPQPGLTLPLDPEIALLIDELSSMGARVRQVVPPKNRHRHKMPHVNATRLVLTELKRVLTIRGASSSMTSSNNLQSSYNLARNNKWILDSEVDDTLEIPRVQSARLKNYQVTPGRRHRTKYSTGSGKHGKKYSTKRRKRLQLRLRALHTLRDTVQDSSSRTQDTLLRTRDM